MTFSFFGKANRELCPYCFEYFGLKDTPFRCMSPPHRCAPEVDGVKKKMWGEATPIARIIPEGNKVRRSARCPSCGQESHRRICPSCHMDLPHNTGEYRNYIFAIIGAKEAGKSHYIAVLINQLRKHLGPRMDILLEPLDDETRRRYKNEFYRHVYEDGTPIPETKSAIGTTQGQVKTGLPMIYSLTFSRRNWRGRKRIAHVVTLVFFDTAGEDLKSTTTMAVVNRYISRSQGIILLIDPLQLPRVRSMLGNSVGLPTHTDETAEIMSRTTSLIEEECEIRGHQTIPIPLAITFSKFDALEPIIDRQFQLNSMPDHESGYDRADFEAVNSEMMALLHKWDCGDLLNLVRTRYPRHGFFGLTALGCNPHATGTIEAVYPRRVEDPFLWLLGEHKLIPDNRGR